ncbi:MAG: EamA family transporter [Planctomycetota bacterium]
MDLPRLLVLCAGVLFATGGAALKLTRGFEALDVAGLRSGIAALVLLLVVRESRGRPSLRTLMVAVPYAATLLLFATANRLTTSANAVFLQSTAPIWLTVLSPLLLRERVRPRDLGVLSMLVLGASLFFVASDASSAIASDPPLGNLLAGASGLTWAFTVLGLRALGRKQSGEAARAAALGNALALCATLPFLHFDALAAAPVGDWIVLAWLGTFQVGLAYVLLTHAVRSVPALDATLLLMVEPALNPVFTFLVHGERPAALAIVGGLVIVAALLCKTLLDARRLPIPRS